MFVMLPKRSWRTVTCTDQADITDMRAGAALTWASLALSAVAHADTVIVAADKMVDVVAGKVVDHPLIAITDGRITAVSTTGTGAGAAAGSSTPAGARRIDLSGMTLLPGL